MGIGIDPSYLPSGIRALGEISLLRVREQGDLRFGCGCGVVHTAERRSHEELRRSRGGEQAFLFFLWRTTEQAGVPLGGFARKNGRWVGLRLFAFRWADSISQFEPSYIHTTVRRTHTNTHTLHAYMTGGPCHLGAQGGCPACQHYRAGPDCSP